MKEYDRVMLIKDRAEYAKEGVHKGDLGTISLGNRNGYVLVLFDGKEYVNLGGYRVLEEIDVGVRVEDLEVVEEYKPNT